MTTILNTRESTFRLVDETQDDDNDAFCDVRVKIDHQKYNDGNEFYNITYTYTYSNESDKGRSCNPLYDNQDHVDGEIIAVNELSSVLCKYLLMPIDELRKHSGSVTGQCYKKSIMRMITELWD